jgi:hypothetical protein
VRCTKYNMTVRYQISGDDGTLVEFLEDVCKTLNEALNSEKQNVSGHKPHPPFQFQFSESDEPQANAMQIDGVSVVWITKGMLGLVWTACDRLSRAEAVVRLFNRAPTNQIHAVLFQNQLAFILCHEYTHHVHGHLGQSTFGLETGDIQTQVFEVDADCYAIYFVLAHLINGVGRAQAVERLNCTGATPTRQDEALFSSFVLAIGGFLFATETVAFDPLRVCTRQYPPLAARMNWIMQSAVMDWCRMNRPHLKEWMTSERWRALMLTAATAVWGMNGGVDWSDQVAFLNSAQGQEYTARVMAAFVKYRDAI